MSADVADVVATYPQADAVLSELGVTARSGALSSCAAAGCSADTLVVKLAQTLSLPLDETDEEWGEWAIDELIDHIVAVHHGFLRCELDRCRCLLEDVSRSQPSDLANETLTAFSEFQSHMLDHIDHEEQRLFPGCRTLEQAPYERVWTTEQFLKELRIMEHGHDDTMMEMSGILALTQTLAGMQSSVSVGSAMTCLERLQQDLNRHSLKEDDYLLPAITHAEELLDRRREGNRRMSGSFTTPRD